MNQKKIIIITGQTATGKTSLALKKARLENGELISADSRQAYKHLDIITGKDLPLGSKFHKVEEKNGFDIGYYLINPEPITHNPKLWLYDIVDPKQYFSSFDYESLAIPLIKQILDQGKTPIVVGGTYFYLYNLLYDIDTNVPPNWELRKELDNKSVEQLQQMLKKINPKLFESLNESDRQNPRRLIRKIEISKATEPPRLRRSETTGEPRRLNEITLKEKLGLKDLEVEYIGLRFKNKDSLHEAIKIRVKERLKSGAIEEVKNLLKMGYKETDPGLKTIGYREIIKYLKTHNPSPITHNQMSQEWQIHEHQYAKRQYTFMKKDPNIKWKEV
ncbi:MAG: tRNA dimethylallyltransferase [Candidatus Roizmanbacteria bacterium]|nr:MAG: tRNA dimethylallyltransferase [Candidatus Roizmanbacteria bacterium]